MNMSSPCGQIPAVKTTIQQNGKNIEGTIKQPPVNTTTWNRYLSIIVVMASHLLDIPIVASVETQRYLAFILALSVELMDIYLGSVHKCNL